MAYTERQAGSPLGDLVAEHAQVLSIALFLALCCALFGTMTPTFLTSGNILNVIRQAAPVLVVAVVMTSVIATATTRTGAAWRMTLRMLPLVRKVGVMIPNSAQQSARNRAMDNTCACSATRSARGDPA